MNDITHVTFKVSCNTCKFCYKEKMKCRPESEDCMPEYDLEESDFTTLKKCDFWYPKDGLYFWVDVNTAIPTYSNKIVMVKVSTLDGDYMSKAHYNAKKDCWFDIKGHVLDGNVYEWAIEIDKK